LKGNDELQVESFYFWIANGNVIYNLDQNGLILNTSWGLHLAAKEAILK